MLGGLPVPHLLWQLLLLNSTILQHAQVPQPQCGVMRGARQTESADTALQ